MGSLGSGNHFLEVQRVTDVFREEVADEYGLEEDGIVVLIHCGSRGLGHQTCNDYLRQIEKKHGDLLAELPDKELAAAPAGSELADEYYGAMGACINFAWVNRQLITHQARKTFGEVFDADPIEDLEMELLYDVGTTSPRRRPTRSASTPTDCPRSATRRSTVRIGSCTSTARARPARSRPATRTYPKSTATWASP